MFTTNMLTLFCWSNTVIELTNQTKTTILRIFYTSSTKPNITKFKCELSARICITFKIK